MKVPFTLEAWLKDKSQKVETRDGRIVHNIWPVKNEIIAKEEQAEVLALIDGEEDALIFFKDGKYLPINAENPFDLFIITPEPELTNWQTFISGCLQKYGLLDCGAADRIAKECSSELLDLARKELTRQGNIILSIEEFEKHYVEAQEKGRKEALKDLPRWVKVNDGDLLDKYSRYLLRSNEGYYYCCGSNIMRDGYMLLVDNLEKLPKED